MRVARHNGGCGAVGYYTGAMMAYCCAGIDHTDHKIIVERETPALSLMQSLLVEYVGTPSPVCPTEWDVSDYLPGQTPTKRDAIHKRSLDYDMVADLTNMVAQGFSGPASSKWVKIWNNFASYFSSITYTDIRIVLFPTAAGVPLYDPHAFFGDLICHASTAGKAMRDHEDAAAALCENLVVSKRDDSDDDDEKDGDDGDEPVLLTEEMRQGILGRLTDFMDNDERFNHTDYKVLHDKRAFTMMGTSGASEKSLQPSVYAVLEGITAGTITLVYARWQAISGKNSKYGTGNDPLLELAYWIGTKPGDMSTITASLQDGAHKALETVDKWIVLHLHFLNDKDMFKKFTIPPLGDEFSRNVWQAGITQITMYHGQKLVQGHGGNSRFPGSLRVANSVTAAAVASLAFNARSYVLDCPGASRWYPSFAAPATPDKTLYKNLLAAWVATLVTSGIINEASLALIYPAVQGAAKQFVAKNFQMIQGTMDYAAMNWLPSGNVLDNSIRNFKKA